VSLLWLFVVVSLFVVSLSEVLCGHDDAPNHVLGRWFWLSTVVLPRFVGVAGGEGERELRPEGGLVVVTPSRAENWNVVVPASNTFFFEKKQGSLH
jgi:hypothetical protein